jgi:hypothetical protein
VSRQGTTSHWPERTAGPSTTLLRSSRRGDICPATTVAGSAALPFVISTGAPQERSGEIGGYSGPLLEMFFDRAQRSGGTCGSFRVHHDTDTR